MQLPGVHVPFDLNRCTLLPRSFFERDPRKVAPELLGKVLVRRGKTGLLAGRFVEVEAYLGQDDPAAHSAAGLTARNAVLFGPGGHAYVYFIYGMYFCLNISCLKEGAAGCVLIRALEPLAGLPQMLAARGLDQDSPLSTRRMKLLASGPGRLCEAFAINRERDNGKDLTARSSDLLVYDDGSRSPRIRRTPRIGITKAARVPLRYLIGGNAFVSSRE